MVKHISALDKEVGKIKTLIDQGKMQEDWRSLPIERKQVVLNAFGETLLEGVFPFMVSTRMQYRSLEGITNNANTIVKIANDQRTVWELLRLFCFHKFDERNQQLALDFEQSVRFYENEINHALTENFDKYCDLWYKEDVFWVLANLTSVYDKKKLGAVNTPIELVKEIEDHIPEDAWCGAVLDPACGNGTFLFEAKKRLQESCSCSEENALHHIVGVDISPRKCYTTSALLDPTNQYRTNIYLGNSLDQQFMENIMREVSGKFDVIVGNPPFHNTSQDRQAKGNKQKSYKQQNWPLFVQTMLDNFLSKDGYLTFITPKGFLAGTYDIRDGRVHLIDKFTEQYNILHLNIETRLNAFFPKIGSSFSYYIVQNSHYNHTTYVISDYDTKCIDLAQSKIIPPSPHPILLSINEKTLHNSTHIKYDFHSVNWDFKNVKDARIKDMDRPYKGYCSGGQRGSITYSYWPKQDRYFGMRKVLIGKQDRSYLPFVDNEGICVGQNQLWYMPLKETDRADAAYDVFNSKLFQFLIMANKYGVGPETWIIYNLPALDLTKRWTDTDIYQHFALTQEEINYIESNVNEDKAKKKRIR